MSDIRLERALHLIYGEWGGDRESSLAWLDNDEYWIYDAALSNEAAKLCLTVEQRHERSKWTAYLDGILTKAAKA
jgi:hypothetical protein